MDQKVMTKAVNTLQAPCYVFDTEAFKNRIESMKRILGREISLCYAMKANPFIAGYAANDLELKVEVCSPGEFAICERAGVPMEKIVLSGVNKEESEIRRVIDTYDGKGVYTVESPAHWEILKRCASNADEKFGSPVKVLLRLSAGNQFGMDEETILGIAADAAVSSDIEVTGIQFYSGTQKKKSAVMKKELEKIDSLITKIDEETGCKIKEVEYGPGFYVPYFVGEEPEDMEGVLTEFKELLKAMSFSGHITLEIGRYAAADCGYYFTKVVDVKRNYGQKYVIVDGGIHQLNYYGQMMAMKIPHCHQFILKKGEEVLKGEKDDSSREKESYVCVTADSESADDANITEDVNICGSLCTVNDYLVKNLPLREPLHKTALVFERCGAYSMTESMGLFLSRDLPRIYMYKEDEFFLVRDRFETNILNG